MQKGIVFDIQRFSLHDGPGIRTIVFMKGCPLSCKWCSNPESKAIKPQLLYWKNKCIGCKACVTACPNGAITFTDGEGVAIDRVKCTTCGACVKECYPEALVIRGREYTVDEIMNEVMSDSVFYGLSDGGLTLSGGEPLAQSDFAVALLKAAKENGISTAIETTGQCSLDVIMQAAPYVDTFLYDVKHVDAQKHRALTDVSNDRILSNLKWLTENGYNVVLRVPVVPEFNDDAQTLQAIVDLAQSLGIKRVNLLPYHEFGRNKYAALGVPYDFAAYSGGKSLDRQTVESLKSGLNAQDVHIAIGG